VSGF